MFPAQDVRVGGRWGRSQYQFTLWSSDLDELLKWVPQRGRSREDRCRASSMSRPTASRAASSSTCRSIARPPSRYGVRVQDIDAALANAYAQRQISTIYTERNQYRVVLEVDPAYQRDPNDLAHIYVSGTRRHAGAALQCGEVRAHDRAAGGQSSGPVSGGHDLVRLARRRDARCRQREHPPGDARHAAAGRHPGGVRRRREGLRGLGRRAAAADPRRAGRGLSGARRALRKPRASADHHLDAAVRGARRAARAASSSTRS